MCWYTAYPPENLGMLISGAQSIGPSRPEAHSTKALHHWIWIRSHTNAPKVTKQTPQQHTKQNKYYENTEQNTTTTKNSRNVG